MRFDGHRYPTLRVACSFGAVALVLLLTHQVRSQPPPIPDTIVRGPVLTFDFPEVHIGIAEYAEGPTGTTVFSFVVPAGTGLPHAATEGMSGRRSVIP